MDRIKGIWSFMKKGDLLLLSLCLLASLYGLLLIASATSYMENTRYLLIQAAALAIGIGLYFLCARLDLSLIGEKEIWIFIFNVALIASLLLFGVDGGSGNRSWIRFSFLPIGIQPAELVKLTFILLLAKQMARLQEEGINKLTSIGRMLLHVGLMCALIMAVSGDAGMAVVYGLLFVIMAFAAGVKLRWFFVGLSALAAGGLLLWFQTDLIKDYWKNRILILFDRTLDPLGIGWQQERSVLAIGSGQITGQGLFQGLQTQSPYESALPARHTDFIFSVAGEELGLVGCILILILLSAIILRCIFIALRAANPVDRLAAFGFAGMLLCQTILNVGMCLYLAPVVGLTLPFFSYGGSSILTLFAAMGMVSGVKVRSLPSWLKHRGPSAQEALP